MTDWCYSNQHDRCPREYTPFYFEVVRGKSKIVYRDEPRVCECSEKTCPCYTKVKDRTKVTKRKRKQ